MIDSPLNSPSGLLQRRSNVYASTGALAALLAVCGLQAQTFTDDFNDGNDDGWVRYDLTAFLNNEIGVPGTWANYNFPDDGNGGKAYQIDAMAHPAAVSDELAPRAFSHRPDVYTRFKYGVDILEWDASAINAFGPIVRANNVGVGTTIGYMVNLNPSNRDLDISLLDGEAVAGILQTVDADLQPEDGPYRFEVLGTEDALVAHVYQRSDARAPIISTAAIDYTHPSGAMGMFVSDFNDVDSWTGAKVTYDNYLAEPLPENTLPQVMYLQPGHLAVADQVPATVQVSIFDVEVGIYTVESSIRLEIDGVAVPNAELTIAPEVYLNRGLTSLPGQTVTYTPSAPPAELGGWHTNRITFRDTMGRESSAEWIYTYRVLSGENALPVGSGEDSGFAVRLVQSDQETENSLQRAEQQLAMPPEIPISLETNTTARVINYTQQIVPNFTPDGYFDDEATFPGIDPEGNTDDLAMEILFYLELPAGSQRFGVMSDDGFQLRSGSTPTDPDALVLGEQTSGVYDGTFEFVVEAAGVYPFRMVYFERGGGAHVELFTQDPDTEVRTLINDTSSAIKAFRSVAVATPVLESTSVVTDTFTEDANASVDADAQRITVPVNGDGRYYRIRGTAATRISTIEVQGADVVITYEAVE